MTVSTLQQNDSTEYRHESRSSSIVEWQIHDVPNPADDATLDGCGCGCSCGCGCGCGG